MNPFLASTLILILRWLQFIGTRLILDNPMTTLNTMKDLDSLLDDTGRTVTNLSNYALISNGMIDNDGKKIQ